MPVHNPGPRLGHAIPFKHLAQLGHGGGHGGSANVHLNLTPFVDMMTILVSFLLMVFSASGEILTAQAGLELPAAGSKVPIQLAPVITITQQAIMFQNEHMTETATVINDTSPQWKVVELFERMKQESQLFELGFEDLPDPMKERCSGPSDPDPKALKCLRGLTILQADRRVPAKVINRVIKTANAAGYNNLMFAVDLSTVGQYGVGTAGDATPE
jgi:biopolymer transport protein ExbD